MAVIREVFGFATKAIAQSKLDFKILVDGGQGEVFKSPDRGWAYRWFSPEAIAIRAALNAAETGPVSLDDGDANTGDANGDALQELLNFIAEFESNGNYNAYYLHANNINDPELISMSLGDVRKFQDQFVADGNASSAAGRYQIIRRTLDGLMISLSLSTAQLFDEATQDRMAIKLLEGRKLRDYMNGDLSTVAFAKNVAKEWASMPVLADTTGHVRNVKRGQSFYAGDGLNKAHASADDFEAKIEALRN